MTANPDLVAKSDVVTTLSQIIRQRIAKQQPCHDGRTAEGST